MQMFRVLSSALLTTMTVRMESSAALSIRVIEFAQKFLISNFSSDCLNIFVQESPDWCIPTWHAPTTSSNRVRPRLGSAATSLSSETLNCQN